jgi:hypothetical protein
MNMKYFVEAMQWIQGNEPDYGIHRFMELKKLVESLMILCIMQRTNVALSKVFSAMGDFHLAKEEWLQDIYFLEFNRQHSEHARTGPAKEVWDQQYKMQEHLVAQKWGISNGK